MRDGGSTDAAEVDVDVVVVGSGIAGLSATYEAAAAGASVLLVEGADRIGGSSRLSSGLIMASGTRQQCRLGIEGAPEELRDYYAAVNHWLLEPAVVDRLCLEAGTAVDWLVDLGVTFHEEVFYSGGEVVPRGHMPRGEAAEIVDVLTGAVRRMPHVQIALGRTVDRLCVEDGRVVGVADGAEEVRTGSVVLATGGFGANRELLRRLLPQVWEREGDWVWYVGGDTAQGSIFGLVAPLDAHIVGHDRCQLTVRPRFSTELEPYLPGWLVTVDAQGRRFCDETSAYNVMELLMRAQPRPVWALFDEAAKRAAQPKSTGAAKKVDLPGIGWEDWVEPVIDDMLSAGRVHRAKTLAELAEVIGVPAQNLEATVDRYNRDTEAGEDTQYRKPAHLMRSVATGPFYATELRLIQLGVTSVGPRTDADAQVVDATGRVIPGLLAAGECTGGVLGDAYLGSGNSIANCLVFGRRAGRVAAAARAADSGAMA